MNILVPICLLFSFACLVSRHNRKLTKQIFTLFFLFLLLFLSVRFGFGPDYYNYWNIFDSIQGADVSNHKGYGSSVEPMFLYYMQLFPNYSSFIAFNSLIFVAILYILYKRFVDYNVYWYIILFLLLDPNSITGVAVAMRSSLCMLIFLIAFAVLNSGIKYSRIIYCVLIITASLFHTSSIFFILFVLLNKNNVGILYSKVFVVCIITISILIVITGYNAILDNILNLLLSSVEDFEKYEGYEIGTTSSFTALLYRIVSASILIYLVWAARKDNDMNYRLIYKFGIIAISLQLFMGQSIISDRFLMYLNPLYIIAITRGSKFISKPLSCLIMFLVIAIPSYILLTKMGKDYAESFLEYQTIFSAPYIP